MGGPGIESLTPGGVPPAPSPHPLTPSGQETLAPINARVFSCALSKRKWASWRLHKTGSNDHCNGGAAWRWRERRASRQACCPCRGNPAQSEQWYCWIGHRRIISASAENRGNSCQRKHPAEILALGPSCASHRRSSNTNSLCGRNSTGSPEICDELSKGYFATTFLSSSLTCPATQSALCGAFIPFTGFASSAVRFNGRARQAERAD